MPVKCSEGGNGAPGGILKVQPRVPSLGTGAGCRRRADLLSSVFVAVP